MVALLCDAATQQAAPHWPGWWWAAMTTAITAACLVLLFMIIRNVSMDATQRWRLTLVLLAVLVAMLSSYAAASPGAPEAFATLVGRVGLPPEIGRVTFSFAGPFAIWLAAFWVLVKLLGRDLQERKSHDEWTLELEKRLGFHGFDEWLASLGINARSIVERDQWGFISDLLPHVFYAGPSAFKRLERPIVSTAMFYFGRSTVKLQRIQAVHGADDAKIYDSSVGSLSGSTTRSVLMFREGDRIRSVMGRRGMWASCKTDSADCLITAVYDEETPEGDYTHIDMAKYIASSGINQTVPQGSCEFVLFADRQASDFSVWEMRRSGSESRLPVAAIFREIKSRGSDRRSAILRFSTQFQDWMDTIQEIGKGNAGIHEPEVIRHCNEIHELLTQAEVTDLRTKNAADRYPHHMCGHWDGRHNGVLVTIYSWPVP